MWQRTVREPGRLEVFARCLLSEGRERKSHFWQVPKICSVSYEIRLNLFHAWFRKTSVRIFIFLFPKSFYFSFGMNDNDMKWFNIHFIDHHAWKRLKAALNKNIFTFLQDLCRSNAVLTLPPLEVSSHCVCVCVMSHSTLFTGTEAYLWRVSLFLPAFHNCNHLSPQSRQCVNKQQTAVSAHSLDADANIAS